MTENVNLSRALVSEQYVKNWFLEVKEFLQKNYLINIAGLRSSNTDETALLFNPKEGSALAKKGTRNVYNIVGNNKKVTNFSHWKRSRAVSPHNDCL